MDIIQTVKAGLENLSFNKVFLLSQKVFPLTAPEDILTPFVVYHASEGLRTKSLSGVLPSKVVDFEMHLVCTDYPELRAITSEVVQYLQSLERSTVGSYLVQEIDLDAPIEVYDEKFGWFRCVIDFKLYY